MSASVKAQITPEVLTWARDSSGFSQEEIAGKLDQKSATLDAVEAWEQGRAQPTYAQLERLAKIYKRPIAVFFFPSPPQETAPNEKFRSLPDVFAQSLSPQIRYLVRKALAKQMNLYDLYGEGVPAEINTFRSITENIPRNNIKALAVAMREAIGVSLDEQFGWETVDIALKRWRERLENIGIWIFKDAFKDEDYCGFCLCDENFPVVYLNNSMKKQRQIFTLFHEMGHLLISKGGVDFRKNVERKFKDTYRTDEVFCNAFAGELLVPSDNIDISTAPDDREIIRYAKKYSVSREVILRKYLDRNLITREFYRAKVEEWDESWKNRKQNEEKKDGGGSYYATQQSYLGDKYLAFLFGQYYQQRIDEFKLADYLGVKVQSLETLEGYMLRGKI